VGAGSNATGDLGSKARDEPAESTLKNDETGEPFQVQHAAQIRT
jgi:hypothetical protein